jgi:hypothetical protein
MRILAPALRIALLGAALAAAGCSQPVDLKQALQVTDVVSGYHDAGIVDGRNKIVPTIAFRLKKSTDQSLRPLSVNVLFKKLPPAGTVVAPGSPADEEWDEKYIQSVRFDGNETAPLVVRAEAGFTGDPPQSRADILKHRLFQDVRVHVLAKYSASNWVEIGTYDIPRTLVAQ